MNRKKLKLFIPLILLIVFAGVFSVIFQWPTADSHTKVPAQADILFQNNAVSVSGSGVQVNQTVVTVSQGGYYCFSGNVENGQIKVDTTDKQPVTLCLKGVQINNPTDDGIHIQSANETTIVLAKGTSNKISCGTKGSTATTDASGAGIFSKENLTLSGTGKLVVEGYINDGIKSKKNLTILSGDYTIDAIADGVVATENLTILDGTFSITTGKGSSSVTPPSFEQRGGPDVSWDWEEENEVSTKGIKCGGNCTISNGTFSIDSQDDALHTDANMLISQGTFTLATGDDGIHADTALTVENGSVQITKSNEGLEANQIQIKNGSIQIVSFDDGMNAYGGENNMGGPGGSAKTTEETPSLQILGGFIHVDSGGDGLDSNGNLLISGGEILVAGSTNSGNGALDIGTENGGNCQITGGTILAMGASGMAETFDETSSQCSFCYNHTETIPAGSSIEILDKKENVIFTYKTKKESSSVVFSSSELKKGEVHTLKINEESVEISQDTVSVTEGETGHGFGGRPKDGEHPGGGFGGGRGDGREPGRKPDFPNEDRPMLQK